MNIKISIKISLFVEYLKVTCSMVILYSQQFNFVFISRSSNCFNFPATGDNPNYILHYEVLITVGLKKKSLQNSC